jgi:oligopeptide transport system substrate-binding protein
VGSVRTIFHLFVRAFAAAAVLLGSGCGRHRQNDRQDSVIRISQRNEPTDLDPATASLPDEFFIIRALSEGLLVPNPAGGDPLPAAATQFEVSTDGLTYTFHLRPDATWSNGEPLTAADFIASWRRVLTAATAAPKAHLFFPVKNARAFLTGAVPTFDAVGLRAADASTIVITLEHPMPLFPRYVASGAWIPVNPRVVAAFGRKWTEPSQYVGNGPFVLTEWRPQQRITVRRNTRYTGADPAHVDQIEFVRFDNADTEDRAYRAGDVDVTMAVPQSKLDLYRQERTTELKRTPLAETRFISFNTARAPLNDARVRRALALAIDRERIVRDVLRGGQLAAGRFLSPALLGVSSSAAGSDLPRDEKNFSALVRPDLRAGRQDGQTDAAHSEIGPYQNFQPAEARQLLADAGFPGGKGFPTLELAGWAQNPVLEAVQQMWRRELGINVRIVVREAKVHLAALNAGDYDIAFVTNLLDVCDPIAALEDFTAAAPNNFPHWSSAAFDQLIETARRSADVAAVARARQQAEALLLRDAAIAPVYFNVQNWMLSPRVTGWDQDALWNRRYNDLRAER